MQQEKTWVQELLPEDMPTKDMKFVAECCGVDVAVKLMEEMPRLSVYIPDGLSAVKLKSALKRYDGSRDSANRLALECGISISHFYRYVKPEADESRKQLGLFEEVS